TETSIGSGCLSLAHTLELFWVHGHTIWPNLKKATKKKSDDPLKTGMGGGNDSIYMDVDEAVLDIVSRNSPWIKGIEGFESWNPVKSIDNCEMNINGTTDETFKSLF
uniref:Uncharacterized protein n=1 Tax=Romanomermis culicivorax TaxID=13658 RepID=A0A915HWU8_ROMCU